MQAATLGPDLELGQNDLGLLRGFYSAEHNETATFRWSAPSAQLVLAGAGTHVCLQINAARPADQAAPPLTLSITSTGAAPTQTTLHPPRNGWSWLCAALPNGRSPTQPVTIALASAAYNPYLSGDGVDPRDLGVAVAEAVLRDTPPALDQTSGLMLDRAPSSAGEEPLALLGLSGATRGAPGAIVPLTLWWRAAASPAAGLFTFVHLRDAAGTVVASYNAPIGGMPAPPEELQPVAPLADPVALPLPLDLAPGSYRLVAGAFDPATSAVVRSADLGQFEVAP